MTFDNIKYTCVVRFHFTENYHYTLNFFHVAELMQLMEMVMDYLTGSSHGSGRGGPRHNPEVHGGMQQGIALVLLSPQGRLLQFTDSSE